jgi:hypothetical protein
MEVGANESDDGERKPGSLDEEVVNDFESRRVAFGRFSNAPIMAWECGCSSIEP